MAERTLNRGKKSARRKRRPKTHAIAAVTIRKTHPKVRGRKNGKWAKKAAETHAEGKRIRKVTEKKNTFQAEVRPKGCFVPRSFRTQKRGKHVRVLYAKLDPEAFKRRKACR